MKWLLLFSLVLVLSCSAPENEWQEGSSFQANIQPLFDMNCTRCHGSSGGLNLEFSESYSELVGVLSANWTGLRVMAYEPDYSVLYLKVSGAAGYGNQMPPNGALLSSSEIGSIRAWIEEGALAN
ncbi:MAG: c-type cytochrome [Candidatus Krumholzibacteria bacterium]|nr:c-type cytochrome [Candidatus Krumholzibacteria bacterium]